MRYILLLRGVNVGGKNKVSMSELKNELSEIGFNNVESYLNSGNLFFDSDDSLDAIKSLINSILETYTFNIPYVLFDENYYNKLQRELPEWWFGDLARRDVLFVTNPEEIFEIQKSIESMELHNELVYFSHEAIFWGKIDEKEFLKTAYHKELIKKDYYKRITIRNGNTFDKIKSYIHIE